MESIGFNDVIASDKSCIESDSEEVRAWESVVIFEPDHDISKQL